MLIWQILESEFVFGFKKFSDMVHQVQLGAFPSFFKTSEILTWSCHEVKSRVQNIVQLIKKLWQCVH